MPFVPSQVVGVIEMDAAAEPTDLIRSSSNLNRRFTTTDRLVPTAKQLTDNNTSVGRSTVSANLSQLSDELSREVQEFLERIASSRVCRKSR